jgi:hypothetical protein
MDRLRRQPTGEIGALEERVSQLTDKCAEIIRRWAVTSDRHTRAVSRFENTVGEWIDAGASLQADAADRIHDIEQALQRERRNGGSTRDDSARELQEQASSLAQVCLATTAAAREHLERSDARLALLEQEIGRRLDDLTCEIRTAVTQSHSLAGPAPEYAQSAPESADDAAEIPPVAPSQPPAEFAASLSPTGAAERLAVSGVVVDPVVLARLETIELKLLERERTEPTPAPVSSSETAALAERLASLEQTLLERDMRVREAAQQAERVARRWRLATVLLGAAAIVAGLLAWQLRGEVKTAEARVEQALRDSRDASASEARDAAAARTASTQQITEAIEKSARAQTIGEVLAAPDLTRYDLSGRDALAGASGQVRWSRTRGLVFSGSRIPAAPEGSTYQLWLLTRAAPAPSATFVPDGSGAASVVVAPMDPAPDVTGAVVTIETSPGSQTPSSNVALVRP